jgi:hypothetical protein
LAAVPLDAGFTFGGPWFGLELPPQQHPVLADGFAFDVRAWAPVSAAVILMTWLIVISLNWIQAW